jgi:hypothetical protein
VGQSSSQVTNTPSLQQSSSQFGTNASILPVPTVPLPGILTGIGRPKRLLETPGDSIFFPTSALAQQKNWEEKNNNEIKMVNNGGDGGGGGGGNHGRISLIDREKQIEMEIKKSQHSPTAPYNLQSHHPQFPRSKMANNLHLMGRAPLRSSVSFPLGMGDDPRSPLSIPNLMMSFPRLIPQSKPQ